MLIGGIILCGGKSSRMGTSKAMLPFGQEVMLARVWRILSEAVFPLVVVAADEQELPLLPKGTIIARDERPERGPLEGLRAGLAALRGHHAQAAYVTSCDVPLLSPLFVRRMIKELGGADVAVPVEEQEGKLFHHPLAAVYRTRVLPAVEQLLDEDRLRMIYLYDLVATRRVNVEELRAVDPELASLRNVNHPDEYQAALVAAGIAVEK